MVTVTSATQNAPTVFPLAQCGSGSGDMVTLGCLATGFNPHPSLFMATRQYFFGQLHPVPSDPKGSGYMGISQIQVSRQDWEARKPFKCVANHAAGQQHASMAKPNVVYEPPTLKVCSSTDVGQGEAYFSCFAKDFSPNTYSFTWMKDDQNYTDTTAVVNTLSQGRKDANGTVLYSASSLLTLPVSQLGEGSRLTCVFTGRGERNTDVQRNSSTSYKECQRIVNCETPDVDISIIPPTNKDLLVNKKGTVTCRVTVIRGTLEKLGWEDEKGKELVVEPLGVKKSGIQEVKLDITFDEWSQGVKRTCVVESSESIDKYTKDYHGNMRGSLKRPSVFMLPPVEQTREDAVILTCYVKDFSPEEVYVAWLVDDEDADAKYLFSTTKPVENNGSFYVYSQLILTRDQWEQTDMVYSCAVYHAALANSTRSIVRSIGYRTFEKTNVVNLNMNVPETCKA